MQSVSVHIAVLAVGKDAAPTQAISELATQAGHEVIARATVADTPATIKAQLQRWIDEPNIDVVIVSGGMESENAGAAVKPLITQTLPGFTDLFRYLAFQEIGASAMLSNAEAAQCGSTFVFVLPASAGAVKAAMEKLILPQLDPNTTPKNLVSSMPRVRALGADAVPTPIAKEKTASGSGLTPKMPSGAARRERSPTGANVIRALATSVDASFDPPTRPIDIDKLEEQIALSEHSPHDAETRQIDLASLPDEASAGSRKTVRTEPAAVVPPPKNASRGGLLPDPPAPRGPVPLPDSGVHPIAPLPTIAPVPPTRTKQPTQPQPIARTKQTTGPIGVPAVIPKSSSGPIRKPPTHPPVEPPGPAPVGVPLTSDRPRPPRPPTGPARVARPPEPILEAPEPEVVLPASAAVVDLPRRRQSTPPPPPPARTPTKPPPVRAKPAEPDVATLVAPPLRASGDLPAGKFTYPEQKRSSGTLLFVIGAIAALAIGFVVVVFIVPKLRGDSAASTEPAQPVVATAPIDAAPLAVTPIVEDAAQPAAPPEIEMDPMVATRAGSATRPVTPPTPPGRPTGAGPVTRPTSDGSAAPPAPTPEAGSDAADQDKVENAPNNPAPTPGECDEVSCVLSKYDRPCCERFKPKDSDIAPRTAGGLPESLDKVSVRAGVANVKPGVVACGERASQKGTVKIAVSVRPDGSVSGASVVASPDPALGECVADVMKKATFGKSVNGGTFTYPFVF